MLHLYQNSASQCPHVNVCDPGAINKSGQAGSNELLDGQTTRWPAAFWRVNSTSPTNMLVVALESVELGGYRISRRREGTCGGHMNLWHWAAHFMQYFELRILG